MNFSEIGLNSNILKITDLGFENPTPIQEQAIPFVLFEETDLIILLKQEPEKQLRLPPVIQKINENKTQTQSIILCPN